MKAYGICICISLFLLLLAATDLMSQSTEIKLKLAWDAPVDENGQP